MLNLTINKSELQDLPNEIIEINNQNNELTINYGGTGDLYFTTFNTKKETEFIVEREDLILYRSLTELFAKLETDTYYKNHYSQLFPEKEQEEINLYLKRNIEKAKESLYDEENNKIVFVSCDLMNENDTESRNYFEIIKLENRYQIKLVNKGRQSYFCIRVNTNRSEYGNLVFLFTDLRRAICDYHNYYQISIDDYMENKKLIKRK